MPLSISTKTLVFISFALIAIQGVILFSMDRTPFCKCGDIGLWGGVYLNSQMSQQFADIYTPSHFLHGVAFFWILWLVRKKIPMTLATMLAVALVVEAGWEILENTEFIINRYRSVTISFDYYGDSIFNSLSDTLFMVFGFLFAWRTPGWTSIAAVLVLELGVLWLIRDNLTLNVLMLLYPLDAVRIWQAGG